MEDHPRKTLKRVLIVAFIGMCTVVALVWAVPAAVKPMLAPTAQRIERKPSTHSTEDVDTFVREWVRRLGAVEVVSREEGDGVIRAIYRLPRGVDPDEIATRLRSFADEEKVEVYASLVDGLDVELRAYHGPRLRQQLLLVPDLPEPPEFGYGKKRLKRPMLALVVTGLGESEATHVIKANVPITVAIQPFSPFSLRNARMAASRWHEVLVDLPLDMDISEGQSAIPHASGVWVDGTPVRALDPADVIVVPADMVSDGSMIIKHRTDESDRVLPAQHSDRRSAMETLTRARHIAARQGGAALVVDVNDPDLEAVIAWSERAETQGYRMVLATEAVRLSEVHGPIATGSASGGQDDR